MKEIKLTKGMVTIVDDDDYEWLNKYEWSMDGLGYAQRARKTSKGWRPIKMHREITNTPNGLEVDHINHNKLDNRRSNLRICTHAQNGANRTKQVNNSSGTKGVYWFKPARKWTGRITVGGKDYSLGYFDNLNDAREAHRIKSIELLGEFACPD